MKLDGFTANELRELGSCAYTEGAEIPVDMWPLFSRFQGAGLVTMSAARGPGRAWKRAEPVGQIDYCPYCYLATERPNPAGCVNCWEVRHRMEDFLQSPNNVTWLQEQIRLARKR